MQQLKLPGIAKKHEWRGIDESHLEASQLAGEIFIVDDEHVDLAT